MEIIDSISVWVLPIATVVIFSGLSEYLLVTRPSSHAPMEFRAIAVRRLIYIFISILIIIFFLPIAESTKNQIFSLFGLATTGLIVYVIAEPLRRILVPPDYLSPNTNSGSNAKPKLNFDGKVFVSYRREDSQAEVDRLCDKLFAQIGREKIFRDIDSISLGQDFRTVVSETLDNCAFGIVVIGKNWVGKNSDGSTRIQQDGDLVRMEVRQMLQREIPVIPLLIDNMNIPSHADLPEDLHDLVFRNASRLRPDPDFEGDVERLIRGLSLAGQPK